MEKSMKIFTKKIKHFNILNSGYILLFIFLLNNNYKDNQIGEFKLNNISYKESLIGINIFYQRNYFQLIINKLKIINEKDFYSKQIGFSKIENYNRNNKNQIFLHKNPNNDNINKYKINNKEKNKNNGEVDDYFIYKNIYTKLISGILIFLVLVININFPRLLILYLYFCYNYCCGCIRTGIYGGSFNPIHNGHIALARQMLDAGLMDEVWFVVSPLNPFKKENTDLLSDDLRLEMTKLALEGEPNMMANDFEFHLPKPSFTWQTLQAMTEQYPNREFVLIVGADNWQFFHLWYNYQGILDNYSVVVYPREGVDLDTNLLPKNVKLLNAQLYPISSTQVRQYIKEGKSIDNLIPKSIIPKAIKYYKGK